MKLDRTKLSVVDFRDSQDKEYWMQLSPEKRLQALQTNRQAAYGKPNASGRLQRVLEIAEIDNLPISLISKSYFLSQKSIASNFVSVCVQRLL